MPEVTDADTTDVAPIGGTFPPRTLPARTLAGHDNPSSKRVSAAQVLQFGTSDEDVVWSVAIEQGQRAMGGSTRGLLGATSGGGKDAFIRFDTLSGGSPRYDQFGTVEGDEVRDLLMHDRGSGLEAYAVGQTDGPLVSGDVDGWDPASGDGFLRIVGALNTNVRLTHQLGTGKLEELLSIELAGERIFIAGGTLGTLGDEKFGDEDNIVLRYRLDGTRDRVQQFGTDKFEEVLGLAFDGDGIFVAGQTNGDLLEALPWQSTYGRDGFGNDAFLARFGVDGTPEWLFMLGADGWDAAQGVVVGDDAVYLVGRVEQTPVDGCVPVAGVVVGCDGQPVPPKPAVTPEYDDGFVLKIALDEQRRPHETGGWMDVFGGCQGDTAQGVVLGSSSTGEPELYVVGGHRGGEAHGGPIAEEEALLRIYDPADGRLIDEWVIASAGYDRVLDLAQDPTTKTVHVVGQTQGALPGATTAGSCDAFVITVPR